MGSSHIANWKIIIELLVNIPQLLVTPGKRLHSYGKSPALVGKSANEMAISATLNDQNGILLRYQIFQEYMEDMGCMEYYWTIHIHM
jgi:hypothetical protein